MLPVKLDVVFDGNNWILPSRNAGLNSHIFQYDTNPVPVITPFDGKPFHPFGQFLQQNFRGLSLNFRASVIARGSLRQVHGEYPPVPIADAMQLGVLTAFCPIDETIFKPYLYATIVDEG